jgi:hypothetical protein
MITVVHEHSVDLDLLPKNSNILDLGCRGFLFTNEMERLGHKVFPVDIDTLPENRPYYRIAISDNDGKCGIQHDNDKQATRIKEGSEISCYTLESFSLACAIDVWDLIKIDIEGAELQVIQSLKCPPAKQLSIEFHLHTGIYGINEMTLMVAKLQALGYEAVSHEMTSQHGAGVNYWDSLFILR